MKTNKKTNVSNYVIYICFKSDSESDLRVDSKTESNIRFSFFTVQVSTQPVI